MAVVRGRDRRPIILDPVRPNLGVQAAYRRRLDVLIEEMQADLSARILALYRRKPPRIAADARTPAMDLRSAMRQLARQWQARFDVAATELAVYFSTEMLARSDGALRAALDRAGFAINFTMTPVMRDAYQAAIGEQVGLIKSIASEHLTDVEGLVMRSVQSGRDLSTLSIELRKRYDLTKARAALISRDQNNKATAVMNRVRQQELGIKQAVWMHSAGGKKPRPGHVAFASGQNGGPIYDVAKGAYIDGAWIHPGELINCRCVSRSIIAGFG